LDREPGEALCPNRYPIEVLEQIKKDVGERTFSAQYQGTPKAGEGSWFKKSFLPLVDTPPKQFTSLVRYWDKAASTTKKSPYSVGVLMGKWQGNFWVLDVVRGRWTPGQREAVMKRVVNQDKAQWGMVTTWVEQEPGSGGKESAQATVRNLAGFIIRTDRPTGKKEDRAKPYQAQAEEGNVCLIRAPWNTEFLDEHTFYPNSRFKDQVDAGAGAFNKLAMGGSFIA
jgi:predicted phage terminase large subunit-like protein